MIYQKSEGAVIKFLSNLVHKIKESGSRGIFYALNIPDHKLLIQESSMITDEIIDLDISDNMEKMMLVQ